MLRRFTRVVVGGLALVGAGALLLALGLLRGGISARPEPGRLETLGARWLRSAAVPGDARARKNPGPQTAETLRAGIDHFADHCASCHANDGSGDTELGRGMYPRAPDMRQAATQTLSDGELFYIIEHGVRLTGMPAWGTGTAAGEAASWHLVQFIRHLPNITDTELEEMRALNPRTVEEWRQEEQMRRFLAGEEEVPAPSHHEHGDSR